MQIIDQAIILASSKFSESSALVKAFTREHGVYSGILQHAFSKKNAGIYEAGNICQLTWKARLSEQLGTLYLEIDEYIAQFVITDKLKLYMLSSMAATILEALQERDPHHGLFDELLKFNKLLKSTNDHLQLWKSYIHFELVLLADIGFCIDLSQCAATGTTDELYYLSPKTGRAVCKEAGAPFADKLFIIPPFFLNELLTPSATDILEAFKIINHFLTKHLFLPHHREMPMIRELILQQLHNAALEDSRILSQDLT